MAARNERIALALLLALGGVIAQACKKREGSQAPGGDVADDIAAIDAALGQRDQELREEGVVVAYRAPARVDAGAPPTDTPPADTPPTDTPPPDVEPDVDTSVEPPSDEPRAPEPTQTSPVEAKPENDAPQLYSRKSAGRRDRERKRVALEREERRPRSKCERVCVLADTTCDLRERVCSLAEQHPDDVRYEDACRRAEDQCDAATRHCTGCAA